MPRPIPQARPARRPTTGPLAPPTSASTALVGELLRTKLQAPPPRPDLVLREGLQDRLAAGLRGKLTLLAAPAGFGKTTLLGAWRATEPGRAVSLAWVSLDAGDNDLARFWRYVAAALDELHPGFGVPALSLLQSPRPPHIETVLTMLLNGLASLPQESVLVLDDYHAITDPPLHQALAFFLDHLPSNLHLAITSRSDPPLPLARMRARGELAELRTADLRFTADEASSFLNRAMGLDLPDEAVAALGSRTEGWIAGLQLAGLALLGHGAAEQAAFIAAFSGSNRYIVDYLVEEVLARQSPERQRFLLETAVLDRLCGPLCDAVTGGAAGQETLEALERANLFLLPLDAEQRWYRYHNLFADVLRQRLRQAMPDQPAELHRRASAWFAAQGMIREAVGHSLAARSPEEAAALIERHGLGLAVRGEVGTVRGWLDALPEPLVRVRPFLCILHATILMYVGAAAASESRLIDAERTVPAGSDDETARRIFGWAATVRSDLARFDGDLATCVTLARRALELLPATEEIARASAVLNAARGYLLNGVVDATAARVAEEAVAIARASGNYHAILGSLNTLARSRALQGRLREAADTYAEAARSAQGGGGPAALVNGAYYYFGLGAILYEQDALDEVARHLEQGLALVRGMLTIDADVAILGHMTRVRLCQARGDLAGAHAALDEFATMAHERGFAAPPRMRADAMRARLALAAGDLATAERWETSAILALADDPGYPLEEVQLILVRLQITRARAETSAHDARATLEQTLGSLERLLLVAEAGERIGSVIEILLLRALALAAREEIAPALEALGRALALGEQGGYRRIFLDEGAPLAALLRRLLAPRSTMLPPAVADYAALLLEGAVTGRATVTPPPVTPAASVPGLAEPLSERELAVLRLMAAGQANPEIASQLFVATSTVKWYVNSLFGKLAVTSRTQAVARARALGLLSD